MTQQNKTIRIFISSTFKDMHSERDYLVKFVFPELRERCEKKGLSLVDVDLRWGVTEEEAEHGKAIEICLDEIENCKPFFIGILGERYGWTPEKYFVPDEPKYDWLKKLETGHSITALEIYHGVLNKKDMKPRAFFYYRNNDFIKDVPESKHAEVKAESDLSADNLAKIKQDIDKAFTDYNIPGHITDNYPCSFKGLKINWQYVKSSLASELTDDEMISLEKAIGEDNVISKESYVKLNEKQKSIVDAHSTVCLDGLEEFGTTVLENIWTAISEQYADIGVLTDPILIEKAYHQRFMNSRTKMFIGREDILGQISDYINAKGVNKPLFVTGNPGSGKSAIMAIAAQRSEENKDCFNVVRFVGASPSSLDINKLVQGIIRETSSHLEISVDETRIENFKELYQYFREILFTAGTKGKIVVFIDAANQLLQQYDFQHLVWLPRYIPDNVKFILSSIESEFTKNAVKCDLPFLKVGELAKENSTKIANDTLKEYRKELNEKQLKILLSKADSVKPLYLKVACEELRVFPSYEQITSRIQDLPDTIPELFIQMLERLEADHNPQLVKDTLCMIECSMYGLLESELLELLKPADKEKLPVNTWARLYRNLSAYLMNAGDEKEGLLEFFHLQLSEAVKTRYLKNEDIDSLYNKKLADYGLQKYYLKNGKTINTVAYTGIYLYKANEEEILYELLKDIFISEEQICDLYEKIAGNLYDWVANNYDYEYETVLKRVTEKLAKNNFSYQFNIFLNNEGNFLKGTSDLRWVLESFQKSLKVMEKLVVLEPERTDYTIGFAQSHWNIHFVCGDGKETYWLNKTKQILESLLDKGVQNAEIRQFLDMVNDEILRGWSSLHHAINFGNIIGSSKYLIEYPELINSKDNKGWTPLKLACMSGHFEIVKILLGKGADPNILSDNGSSCLHEAAINGDLEITKLLLDHSANSDLKTKNGLTPYQCARMHIDKSPHSMLSAGNDPSRLVRMGKQSEVAELLKSNSNNINSSSNKKNLWRSNYDCGFYSNIRSRINVKAGFLGLLCVICLSLSSYYITHDSLIWGIILSVIGFIFLVRSMRIYRVGFKAYTIGKKIGTPNKTAYDLFLKGNSYMDNQQYNQAEIQFNEAIILDPLFAAAYCNLGLTIAAQSKERQVKESVKYWKKALELVPEYFEAKNNLNESEKGLYVKDSTDAYRQN